MPADRYAADPPAARIAQELDGLTLIYHRPSRTTHLLVSPAPELIAALGEGPADAGLLVRRLAREHSLAAEDDASLEAAIGARLAELAAAGLVWRIPDAA